MRRPRGPSVRLKLTLSYAGFLMVAGFLLLAAMWVFILRYLDEDLVFRTYQWLPFTRRDPLHGFAVPAVLLMVFLLVLGLVGGWLLAGRMLAPLDRIANATRTAASGSLAHRISMGGRRDEFRELADAFDAMLTRLESHVAEQQRFAANASHELRTPLAITQSLLDVARADPSRVDGELVDRLHDVNVRAIDLTEALLVLSRADRGSLAHDTVDLSLLVEEATETLAPLADGRQVTIVTQGDAALATGSQDLLLQLVTNLVHNAIVHNVPGGTVAIATRPGSGGAALAVENTGEPLAPELVATLVEPFRRGADRVRSDHAGVGLGLAIVASITAAHRGSLSLTARDGGGLAVEVGLPAAARPADLPEAAGLPGARAGAPSEEPRPAGVPSAAQVSRRPRPPRGWARR